MIGDEVAHIPESRCLPLPFDIEVQDAKHQGPRRQSECRELPAFRVQATLEMIGPDQQARPQGREAPQRECRAVMAPDRPVGAQDRRIVDGQPVPGPRLAANPSVLPVVDPP